MELFDCPKAVNEINQMHSQKFGATCLKFDKYSDWELQIEQKI